MTKNENSEEKKVIETDIKSKKDLKKFLLEIKDKMIDGSAAPVYAVSAINHVMNLESIYNYLDKDTKELCRDIWLRIEKSGFQAERPPMFFS